MTTKLLHQQNNQAFQIRSWTNVAIERVMGVSGGVPIFGTKLFPDCFKKLGVVKSIFTLSLFEDRDLLHDGGGDRIS